MARRREFVRGAAAISSKRLTSWFQFKPAISSQTSAGGVILFQLNAAALALRPFTIIRTHFEMRILSDQVAATEDQAAIGGAIVSDQAVAVGITAVPTPITDMASDLWFFHQLMFNSTQILTSVGADSPGSNYSVDSKAMRKVDIGQDMIIVSEISTDAGAGVDLLFGGRILVKVN